MTSYISPVCSVFVLVVSALLCSVRFKLPVTTTYFVAQARAGAVGGFTECENIETLESLLKAENDQNNLDYSQV